MTRIRRRHSASFIALLALLMAMLAPATAFAATGDADTDQGDAEATTSERPEDTADPGDDAGSVKSDTSDTSDDAGDAEPGDGTPEISVGESDTSDMTRFGATTQDGQGGDDSDDEGDTDEGGSDGDDGKHCLDHSNRAYDKFEGAGTYTVDGVTFTVSGETVSVEGGDAELCAKAATDSSGTVDLTDGGSYSVDFDNGGGDDTGGDNDGDGDGDGGIDLPDHEWGDNVEICHRTRSATNPYRLIGPAVPSIVQAGHGGHVGPIFDPATMTNGDTWGDIIPAFTYADHKGDTHTFDGLNWPEGESVMEAGCVFGDGEAAAPAISIDKTADVDTVTLVGADDTVEVVYTYAITNTGNVVVELTEPHDDKIAGLDVSDLDGTMLDADETTTVTEVVELGVDDFDDNGEHTNVVTVTGVVEGGDASDSDDTVTDTADATVTVVVEELPEVEPGVGSDGTTTDLGVTDIEVCVGSDVNLTLTTTAVDDVEVTFTGDLDLDDATMSADTPWNETLTGLDAGTYTIDYTADLGNGSTAEGSFTITVEDCGDATPGIGGDGETVDLGASAIEICPGGTATLTLDSSSDEPLAVSFEGLDGYVLDGRFDDVTIGDGEGWTATLDELSVGTYRIRYTVHVGNGSYQTGMFDITVEDCGSVEPGVGSDGTTTDLGVTDIEVCVGSDVNLTLTTTAVDDVEVTFTGDLDLDDATMSADTPWNETLTGLDAGTYTIDYTADLGNGSTAEGSFTITVEDCGEVDDGVGEQPPAGGGDETPDVPVDGDEDDDTPGSPVRTVDLDLELVCPDGVAGYVVTATGVGLDETEGVLSVAYGNTDVPFETVTITLGETTGLEWPIGIDDLDTNEFVVWVTVGETTSEMVALDAAEFDELCTDVLDEVIDAPEDGDTPANPDDSDTPDSDTPDSDTPVDADEVVRDEEDEVLDVVLDQPADEVVAVDADDTVATDDSADSDEELAYTGGSILALLMAGLVTLLSGAGLLRRRG